MPNWLLFLIPSVIWGTTWLTIKFQLGIVAPEVSVAYRFGSASLLLFAWCAARGVSLRFDRRAHASFLVLGALQYGANYVFVYASEGYLTSGLVAVVFVLVVAWNLVGTRVFFGSAPPRVVVGGAALGMLGVALVFWPEVSHVRAAPAQVKGIVLGVLATLSASGGNLWSQRVYARGVAIVPSTAWSTLYASILVALYCMARGIPFGFDPRPPYVLSLAYLSLFGSAFAFVTFLTLLQRIGAGRAAYTAIAIPVLAMMTSTIFEGYRWSALALGGMVLVLVGNVVVLRGKEQASGTSRPASRARM